MHFAMSTDGYRFLCGVCPDENAYVIAPENHKAMYGICSVCHHTVWLGSYDRHWTEAAEIGDALAEELGMR